MTSEILPASWTPIDGRSLGLWFNPRPMAHHPRLLVVHYTAGEGSVHGVYSTLVQRGLSVHFCIEASGDCYQLADMTSHCSHASDVNDFAVGVEMVNRGVPPVMPPHADRVRYSDKARGKPHDFLDFYDVQKAALFNLAEYVTNNLRIPRIVCTERDAIPRAQLFAPVHPFSGVCGHCHVPSTSGKIDPGPRILDELAARWGSAEGSKPGPTGPGDQSVLHDPVS